MIHSLYRLILVFIVTIALVLAIGSTAAAKRFDGYVGGVASGKGHDFIVGNGLNLVFVDRRESFTPYRVCWHRLHAPSVVGTYIVKWTVRHRRKAIWRFHNGVGD